MIRTLVPRLAVVLPVGILLFSAVPASASRTLAAGALQLRVSLDTKWSQVACPPSAPSPHARCVTIRGAAVVPGLGRTTQLATYVMDDITSDPTSVHLTAAITVAGKGEIDFSAVSHSPVCPCSTSPVSFDYAVTSGTGDYAGAEGSGTVVDDQRATTPTQGVGTDAWSGTLSVAGYTFDTTHPVIKGATPKTVKAPKGASRVRVTYKVTAQDPGEGSLAVACTRRSGSWFKLGRTTVRCTTTDANGNTAKASFRVTVRRA